MSAAGLGLHEQARVVGAYRWIETRLFELLGGWAATERAPDAKVLYDVESRRHGFHARLFAERLPVLHGYDHEALHSAPSTALAEAFDALAAVDDEGEGALVRLAGLGRVLLPRTTTGYGSHLALASPVCDAPLQRVLELVLREHLEAGIRTEALLEKGLGSPEQVARVAELSGALEEGLSKAGPGLGVLLPGGHPGPA